MKKGTEVIKLLIFPKFPIKWRKTFSGIFGFFVFLITSVPFYASFEDVGFGARAVGMAGAFAAVSGDAHSIYYNPAGLASLDRLQIGSSYQRFYANLSDKSDIGDFDILFALPAGKWRASLAFKNFSLNDFYKENEVIIGAAKKFQWFSAGFTLKYLSLDYGETAYTYHSVDMVNRPGEDLGADPVFSGGFNKSGFAADLGLQKKLKNWNFALALSNINKPDMGLKNSWELPMVLKMGAGYSGNRFLILAEVVRDSENQDFRAGAEILAFEDFTIRFGFETGEKIANFATGFSYQMNVFSFDYGFVLPLSGIEETMGSHRFGIVFKFGEVVEKEKPSLPVRLPAKKAEITADIQRLIDEAVKEMRRLYLYGLAAERREDFPEAKRYYEQVLVFEVAGEISAAPEIQEIRTKVGDRLRGIEEKEKATQTEEQASRSAKMSQHFMKATEFYLKGEYEKAIEEWEKVLEIDPNHELSKEKIRKAKEQLK